MLLLLLVLLVLLVLLCLVAYLAEEVLVLRLLQHRAVLEFDDLVAVLVASDDGLVLHLEDDIARRLAFLAQAARVLRVLAAVCRCSRK